MTVKMHDVRVVFMLSNLNNESYDKIKGVTFGQAIGDAIGLGTEFMTRTEVHKYYPNGLTRYCQIIQDAHRSRWHKGDWTDDTDMWMCIAQSVIKNNGKVNLTDIARNFKDWHNGTPLGCGGHINKVLMMGDYVEKPFECSELWWKLSRNNAAANGALMRTSILGILPNYEPKMAEDVCKLTHYDPRCIGSCVLLCSLIHSLIYAPGALDYNDLLRLADRYDARIREYIVAAKEIDFLAITIDGSTMGYTLISLFVALWNYFHATSFEDGLLMVVNAGGDADTNAAITCSLLGAKFGFTSIPEYYWKELYQLQLLSVVSERLINLV